MIEAVDPVIVVCPPEFGDGGDCSKYAFHPTKQEDESWICSLTCISTTQDTLNNTISLFFFLNLMKKILLKYFYSYIPLCRFPTSRKNELLWHNDTSNHLMPEISIIHLSFEGCRWNSMNILFRYILLISGRDDFCIFKKNFKEPLSDSFQTFLQCRWMNSKRAFLLNSSIYKCSLLMKHWNAAFVQYAQF